MNASNDVFVSIVYFSVGASAVLRASFGERNGPIWLDEVLCTGREPPIGDCVHQPWGYHNCGHDEDAGVVCGQCLELRKGGGSNYTVDEP
jgi:hypothetical protein